MRRLSPSNVSDRPNLTKVEAQHLPVIKQSEGQPPLIVDLSCEMLGFLEQVRGTSEVASLQLDGGKLNERKHGLDSVVQCARLCQRVGEEPVRGFKVSIQMSE
jgi:hypothetical protein